MEDKIIENTKKDLPKKGSGTNSFILICIVGITLGIIFEVINIKQNSSRSIKDSPKYWLLINRNETLLKHVDLVLGRIGYEKTTNETPWDFLWAWEFPFTRLNLSSLKPHQRVNHFPGTGYITSKVVLATTESKYIPKAFRLPKNKEEFLKYAAENPDAVFVEKNNEHRGVVLKNVTDMDTKGNKFVQVYMPNPFLVDGYMFDIGVYVVLTSVDPLRVYYYNGDVLFRYCKEKYYPFDPTNVKKYVIADDYRPIWEVPSLKRSHNDLSLRMKDTFDTYVRSKGKNPARMWEEVQKAIRDIFLKKEEHVIKFLKNYPSKSNFFEMFRMDLIADEDLNVYLLEANMSPNLSSSKSANQLLYQQLLYSLFSIVDLGNPRRNYPATDGQQDCATSETNPHTAACMEKKSGANMLSANKNIAVWGDECVYSCNGTCAGVCALCRPCLTPSDRDTLLQAYREHLHRADFRRIFPPPMTPNSPIEDIEDIKELTPKNQLLYMWYQGKCNLDVSWCN